MHLFNQPIHHDSLTTYTIDDAVNNIIAQQRISRKQSRALLHQQKRRLVGPGLPLKTIGQLPYGLCYSALSEAYNAGRYLFQGLLHNLNNLNA